MATQQLTWQSIADALSDSIFMVREDASIFYANDYACEKLGYEREELLKMKVLDINPTHDPSYWPQAWQRFRSMGVVRFESRHRHHDGHDYPVLVSTNYNDQAHDFPFVIAHVQDISKTVQNRQQLQLAVESAKVGFWDCNLESGKVYVSPELYRQLGQRGDEVWSLDYWKTLLHPDDREVAIANVDAFLGSKSDEYLNVFRLRHCDGSYRWIESRGTLLKTDDGVATRFMGTHLDVTDQKTIEHEVRRTLKESEAVKRSLQHSNHDLEQFAYVASHDLRAPLRGLKHLVQWVQEDTADANIELPESVTTHLEKMQDQVERMDTLLAGLLEYSRVGRRHHMQREVNLVAILDDAVEMADVPKGFEVIYPKENPTWTTIREVLQRVFQNLIDNAIKHHNQDTGTVRITCTESEDELVFSVIDDGPGIEEKFREKVFEIFRTLHKNKNERTTDGLGLTIVEKLLGTVGGSIEILDVQPRGAEFRFNVPKTLELTDPANPDKFPTS